MSIDHPVIGVDLMGGDYPPERLIEQLSFSGVSFSKFPHLVFLAPEPTLKHFDSLVSESKLFKASFIETKEVIEMQDDPLLALKHKKDAATPIAMTMLANGSLDAYVSIGNTGALIGGAKFHLNTLDAIKRPGLLAVLPTKKKPLAVIDVGANVQCTSRHLIEFALMGIAYQKCMGIENPKVGLLNIGSEKMKGRSELIEAYEALQKFNVSVNAPVFVGNIEGKEAFQGSIDVLVTDGFSGNIFLKTAEGMSSFILEKIMEETLKEDQKNFIHHLAHDLSYAEYPGALICGIDSIVIKCHGYSNAKAIHSGIQGAINLIESGFVQNLKTQLKRIL